MSLLVNTTSSGSNMEKFNRRRSRWLNPWSLSVITCVVTLLAALLLFGIVESFLTRQLDPKGSDMSRMWPVFGKFTGFDDGHTRFAKKYSLYLYREGYLDEDTRLKGVPVIFVPGNAGSHKQSRSYASGAANYWHQNLRESDNSLKSGPRALDFFVVDFNEELTAFHGQTLLDQAEFLNDAITYILSLYRHPHMLIREPELPDPSSVILIGHSMGGMVARTAVTMPNYVEQSINTIITLATPHIRPPVSFDRDIVKLYDRVNNYWRNAYSQPSAIDNPLWHVTTVSIAGGGLDNMVPSDYASIAALIPQTHGFTVFTSTIPGVWLSMDHLAITWCDQLRKIVIRTLHNVLDVSSPTQTKLRTERMDVFKKQLLSGLEDNLDGLLPTKEPATLLTLDDNDNTVIPLGERLVLHSLGQHENTKTYLLPIPPRDSLNDKKFTLLTDQKLDDGKLQILLCSSTLRPQDDENNSQKRHEDPIGNDAGGSRLGCRDIGYNAILLPASTSQTKYPFIAAEYPFGTGSQPYNYLQYNLKTLVDYQFIAIINKITEPSHGWLVAEFSAHSKSTIETKLSLPRLLLSGLTVSFAENRPLVTNIHIPALHSSLLAYKFVLQNQKCEEKPELFAPLLRQYTNEVYESKFFVNVQSADINIHGVSPYVPSSYLTNPSDGLSLQLWVDPTCDKPIELSLKLDLIGSLGRLWMRYRTVFATMPLVIVMVVFRNQVTQYDGTGIFMSFSESLNQCIRTSLPVFFAILAIFGTTLTTSRPQGVSKTSHSLSEHMLRENATLVPGDSRNDLLFGTRDLFFWFLVPFFGLICTGLCVIVNYAALIITHTFVLISSGVQKIKSSRPDENRKSSLTFAAGSARQKLIITSILLVLVSTIIPYHFAYVVLCIVQIATCVRACKLARNTKSEIASNFSNYCHSIFVLMLWVLSTNIPVLVVWIRNLAVYWLSPFSSHHNILSIMPFFLLVETLSTGRMIPRMTNGVRYISNLLLLSLAIYAGVYGVTFAYRLHNIANIICVWLSLIHLSDTSFSLSRLNRLVQDEMDMKIHQKKQF